MSHRHHVVFDCIASAIINKTATVLDTGPGVFIEGLDRHNQPFTAYCAPDGRILLSRNEGGPTVEEVAAVPIPE